MKLPLFPKTRTAFTGTYCCGSSPRGFTRTTVFDIALNIGEDVFTDFDGLVIKEYVDRAGLSGIIHSELSVNLYTDYFDAPDNAEVTLSIPGATLSGLKFYITRREASGRKVSLKCSSKLFCLDTPANFTDADFDDNGEIETYTAISRIASQAGLTSFSYMGLTDVFDALPRLKKDFLLGKNALAVLEKVSAALCGTFREYQNGLIFVPWEQPFMEAIEAEAQSEIKRGFSKTARKLVMTGGGENFVLGSGDYSDTIKLDTPLASDITSGAVFSRIHGKTYTPYSCEVKLPFIPCATSIITIDGEELFTNRVVCYPRGSGIYAKVSCNADTADEWDYSGEISRAMLDKIAVGEPIGKLTILRDGHLKFESGEYPMTSYVYTTENGLMVDSERAAFKGEVLSLEEVPEIKLNSDELLTESKELVGALNELFLAEPEGGDGAQGFNDIAPHLKGYNIWYDGFNLKAINPKLYPAVGVQYPNKTVLTQLTYQIEAYRYNNPLEALIPIIHFRVKIYGLNPGESAVLVGDIDHAYEAPGWLVNPGWPQGNHLIETYDIPIDNTEAYEYYMFISPGCTVENFAFAAGFENPVLSVYSGEKFMLLSYRNSSRLRYRYDYAINTVMQTKLTAACIAGYYDMRTNGWQYSSDDIDAAIKAFNSGS